MRVKMFLLLFFVSSRVAIATTQHEVFTNAVPFYGDSLAEVRGLDIDKATLANPEAARGLILAMRRVQLSSNEGGAGCPLTVDEQKQSGQEKRDAHCLPQADGRHPNIYVLIHLLRWAESSTHDKPKVQMDHWYLYRDVATDKWSQEDFTSAKRLLGAKRLYVLLVQLNAANLIGGSSPDYSVLYTPNYDVTVTKKTPANVAHLYALLQTYTGGATGGTGTIQSQLRAMNLAAPPPPNAVWGGGVLNIQYRPSDILIKSTFRIEPAGSDQRLADDITFDNEGPYWWDVGFAIPIKKISELKLDSTSGTATPAKVNGQNVFAVLDGYLRPVDVKGGGFTAIPHPIGGVAFAKQPLSRILVGGAWGPKASEIYLGAMFVKQPILSGNGSCGSASGASLTGRYHYCSQFTIGINLSVSAIASKLGAPK
jgi:hypothetical protein